MNLAKRNIDANVATEDDFLLASIATMNMFDNEQSNMEVLGFINKAKSLNVYPNIHLSKYEAILLIRLKKLSEAKVCLQKYKADIESKISGNDKIIGTKQWEINNRYINIEYEWAAKMIYKVDKL